MGTIRLPGLQTGIDTTKLISQLMMVEQRTLQKYQERQELWNDRKVALGQLQTKMNSLKSAMANLSEADDLQAYTVALSNEDILTAEASRGAAEGSHSVVVNQLANAERWVHTAGIEYTEDLVGAGTFIYSYNRQEVVIDTTSETTLEDLVGLINNDANNPGVTANVLYYNGAYHLMLNGNEAGSDYQITVNDSNTEVWKSASPFTRAGQNAAVTDTLTSLSQFSGTLAGDEYITISGVLHDGTAVSEDFAITGNTTLKQIVNEINGLFADTATASLENGQIRLADHTSGASQMQLSLAYHGGSGSTTLGIPAISQSTQGGSLAASLAGFGTAAFSETQSAQDSRIKVDGYPPGVDEWITRSSNTVEDVIGGVTLHLNDTGTVQLNLTRNIESVKQKVSALVDAYNDVTTFIRDNSGYNKETKVAGVLMSDSVVTSIAGDLREPLIQQTSGFINSIDPFLTAAEIGLELDGDGRLSFDTDVFDGAVAEDYLGVLGVIGADKNGSSDSNTIRFYGASSNYTKAGTYSVEVTVAGGAVTGARIKLQTESTWRNAAVNGNVVTGDGTFNEGEPVYSENGLQLTVDLSQNGTFNATVRIKQGFAGAMEDALERILKASNGTLPIDQNHVNDQIEQLQDRIEIEQDRLTRREGRLVAQFARLEKTLALLQNQMSALGMG